MTSFSLLYHTCQARNNTDKCCFMFGVFPSPPAHTSMKQQCRFVLGIFFLSIPRMPSPKLHPCWCLCSAPFLPLQGVFIYLFMYIIYNLIIDSIAPRVNHRNPHPSSRDGISAGTGAGQSKIPQSLGFGKSGSPRVRQTCDFM
jgi:hypothetical protein